MRKSFVILAIAISILLTPGVVNAQETSEVSLGIYPPLLEITADPGSAADTNIALQNQSNKDQKLDIILRSFKPSSKANGQIEYLPEGQIQGPDPLIFQKVKIYDQDKEVKSVELNPLEEKLLKVTFNLDDKTPVGDYYFSIIFVANQSNLDNDSGSTLPVGIATNVILSVGKPGDVKGEIVDFKTPTFLSSGPVPITLLIKNNGNQFITPTGDISIKNMFGQEVALIKLLPQYILAGSERYLIDEDQASPSAELEKIIEKQPQGAIIWPEKFLFGFYTLTANVKLSENGPEFTTTTHLVALPFYLVFVLSFFIFILLGIWLRVRRKV